MNRIPRMTALVLSSALMLVATAFQPVAAISEGSSLAWLSQPATASVDQRITSAVGDPSGPRIRVALFNGSGERVRSGGVPIDLVIASGAGAGSRIDDARTDDDGIATFQDPRIGIEGLGYRLQAQAADGASVNSGHIATTPPSGPFDIRRGDVTACSGDCSDTSSQGDTQATVGATLDGYLVLDVGGADLPCAGDLGDSETVTFDAVTDQPLSRTTVTVRLDAEAVTKAASKYQVCFSSPDSTFTARGGRIVAEGEAGLLADCPKRVRVETQACVETRRRDRDGNVVIVFSVPPGDPRAAVT